MNKPVEEMNKDELEEFALKEYQFNIDKRRRLDDLIEQVKSFASKKPKVEAAAEEKAKGDRTPKKVRHIKTGVEWWWNPLYSGNPDLEVIEWE